MKLSHCLHLRLPLFEFDDFSSEGDVISATGFGAAAGWLYVQYAVIHAWIPAWVGQLAITLLISSVTLITTHFLKRELYRRWPLRKRPAENAAEAPQENNDEN